MTTHRDRYFDAWEALPEVPGSGPLSLAEAGYELARFLDGYGCARPDRVSATIYRLAVDPAFLLDDTVDDDRLCVFIEILTAAVKTNRAIVGTDVRGPWSDDDLRLFAHRILKVWDQTREAANAGLA